MFPLPFSARAAFQSAAGCYGRGMKLSRFLLVLVSLCLPAAGLRADDAAPEGDKDSPYEQIKTLTRAMELILCSRNRVRA